MSALPETYIEILSYLRDHPEGLNTRQILMTAQKKRCFILGNAQNTDKISSAAFAMRQKKLITSSDSKRRKIHKITHLGLERLAESIDSVNPQQETANSDDATQSEPAAEYHAAPDDDKSTNNPNDAAMNEIADEIITGIQSEGDVKTEKYRDFIAEFDGAMHTIRRAIHDALVEPKTIAIQDKALKISVLEKLEPMYNEEISQVLGNIRHDLEQLEAE